VTHNVGREDDERYATARRQLADLIDSLVPFQSGEDEPDGGVLTAFVVLAEFEAEDGNRWLTLCSGNGSGGNDLPAWTLRALGFELREWADAPLDDDDDDDD